MYYSRSRPRLRVIQVQLRDIPTCLITELKSRQPENKALGIVWQTGVRSELAHIIPFHPIIRYAEHILSSKGGYDSSRRPKPSRRSRGAPSRRRILLNFFNSPENTLPLQYDTHQEYDSLFSWGIKAVWSDGTVSPIPVHNRRPFTSNRFGTILVSSNQDTSVN